MTKVPHELPGRDRLGDPNERRLFGEAAPGRDRDGEGRFNTAMMIDVIH